MNNPKPIVARISWKNISGTEVRTGSLAGKKKIYEFKFSGKKRQSFAIHEIGFIEFNDYKGLAICYN